MMKEVRIIVFCMIFIFLFMSLGKNVSIGKIDEKVIEALSEENKVNVIIVLENNGKKEGIMDEKEIKQEFTTFEGFSAEVAKEELKNLETSEEVKKIYYDYPVHAFLQDSASLINATSTWQVQFSGINLTGQDETVCILDTGVNYSHQDLGGCLGEGCKVIGGYDFVNDDADPIDDNGHGTHVAGIIGANSSITGIAPGVNIIAIKVLNENGAGSSSNIINGIEWCVNNASAYNISVISMSLGTDCELPGYCYDTYCDYDDSPMSSAINSAVAINISVVIASGNNGNYTHISSPACIENATSVGWSNKDDTINTNSNRNNITELLAPGTSINSTAINGFYTISSGTSMSAPHVAAAFALIRQFKRLEKETILTPKEIEQKLNDTGKLIEDLNSGINFPRIDIYSAILSLDETFPNVSLSLPTNDLKTLEKSISFICNATDLQLSNITLYLWNSTELYNETSLDLEGTFNETNATLHNLSAENYEWNCFACDMQNNCDFSEANFSLIIAELIVNLTAPENKTIISAEGTEKNFSCNASSNFELSNVTFYLWNSSDLVSEDIKDLSGVENGTSFNFTFSQENSYNWNCLVFNNQSLFSYSENNFTIIYDLNSPQVSLVSPSDNSATTSTSLIFKYSVSDVNRIENCSLIVNNETHGIDIVVEVGVEENITSNFEIGNYIWQVNCTDEAGNTGNSSAYSLRIDQEESSGSSSGGSSGGGGGGGSSGGGTSSDSITAYAIFSLNQQEIKEGITKELKAQDKEKFKISGEEHELILESLGNSSATIKIQSSVINFILKIGEEKKINFQSDNFYDLSVRLEDIKNNKASIKLKEINESVFEEEKKIESLENASSGEFKENKKQISGFSVLISNVREIVEKRKAYIGLSILGLLIAGLVIIRIIYRLIKQGEEEKENGRKKSKAKPKRK